jgi:hypothetical protein
MEVSQMLVLAQHFTREAAQRAFDEAAEYRGREWALNQLEKAVGVRSVDDVPAHKYMNVVAAFVGYTIGVPKPTAEPRVICKSSEGPQSTMNEMAVRIYGALRQQAASRNG